MAKADLDPNFRGFLKSLNSHRVKYLLLGGYAVIYYGYHRVTKDLDVWIAVEAANAKKMSTVLRTWAGYRSEEVPPQLFLQPRKVIMFGHEPVRIDILTGPSGVDFHECYARRNVVNLDGVNVPLISLEDLKANKLASGRDKDHADLLYLTHQTSRRKGKRTK